MIFITAKFQVLPEHAECVARDLARVHRGLPGPRRLPVVRLVAQPRRPARVRAGRGVPRRRRRRGDVAATTSRPPSRSCRPTSPPPPGHQPERRPGRLDRARRDEGRALGHGRRGAADRPGRDGVAVVLALPSRCALVLTTAPAPAARHPRRGARPAPARRARLLARARRRAARPADPLGGAPLPVPAPGCRQSGRLTPATRSRLYAADAPPLRPSSGARRVGGRAAAS